MHAMINTREDNVGNIKPEHHMPGAMFQIMPQDTNEDQQLLRRPATQSFHPLAMMGTVIRDMCNYHCTRFNITIKNTILARPTHGS